MREMFFQIVATGAVLWAGSLTVSGAEPAVAEKTSAEGTVRFEKLQTTRWRFGVVIKAQGGPCKGLVATMATPTDWPEQKVKILEEKATPNAKISYRTLDNGVKQMVVSVPNLPAGETASGTLLVEISKSAIVAPSKVEGFGLPKGGVRELAAYLAPSPYIESQHPTIRDLAPKLVIDKTTAWEQSEAIYDYVREKVKYVEGDLKGALAALRDGTGDCEELTSLFIAFCRANKIPARTVWVPGHCYPEFYLNDGNGKGVWIPCQAAGDRQFGGMVEARPILQKGDSFKLPEHKMPQRYVSETVKGIAVKGAGNPEAKFIRQQVSDSGEPVRPGG